MGRHLIFNDNPKAWAMVCRRLLTLIRLEYAKLAANVDQITMATQVLYIISLCNIKFSILFFYDRIFGAPKPMVRYILLAMGCFVIAYGVAGVLGSVLQCVLLSSDSWKPYSNTASSCVHWSLVLALGLVNIVTDVAMLSLPMPLVWSLRMSKSRRWQLVAVFSLGGL